MDRELWDKYNRNNVLENQQESPYKKAIKDIAEKIPNWENICTHTMDREPRDPNKKTLGMC